MSLSASHACCQVPLPNRLKQGITAYASGIIFHVSRSAFLALCISVGPFTPCKAGGGQTNTPYLIDLPTALRLAGAQNLDVQIARQRLSEAEANRQSALERFFPWVAPGISYHRHDGTAQSVPSGVIFPDSHYQSYAPGIALSTQVSLGDAIYGALAAKQLVTAADQGFETQRQDSALSAARDYFDLALAQAAIGVAREALNISTNYEAQVQSAVEAGLAFQGDSLRVSVEAERNRLAWRQAIEQRQVTAARLAQTLHLDPSVDLAPRETDLTPISLVGTNVNLSALIQRGLAFRPELKQTEALIEAARQDRNGTLYGPLVPSIMGQAFGGGLGGGVGNDLGNFGAQQDYSIGIGWRLGPGGLFDRGRQRTASARLSATRLGKEKMHDEVIRQVVEAFARMQSQSDQITTAKRALAKAGDGLWLAQQRREFGVGIVLENIVAEQDLTRARNDYLKAIAESNKAQYELSRAVGGCQSPQ